MMRASELTSRPEIRFLHVVDRVAPRGGQVAAALAVLFLAGASASPAAAQAEQWVNPDVYELRDEVSRLSQEVAALRGASLGAAAPSAGGDGAEAPALSGDVYVRLERLDQAVRSLTGAVEELDNRTRDADKRRQAKLAELEFRLSRIEKGETGAYRGAIPGTEALTEVEEPDNAPLAQGRLKPLQPENYQAGSPPSVLGEIRGAPGDDVVVARPIYDEPNRGGGSRSSGSSSASISSGDSVRYEDALKSIRAGDFDAAEGQLQAFIQENDKDPRVADATFFLGETYRRQGRFHKAVTTYASGLKSYPESRRAADSWLRLGTSLAQLNQTDKACAAFNQVNRNFPDAPASLLREAKNQARRAGCR